MPYAKPQLPDTKAWRDLQNHYEKDIAEQPLKHLFSNEGKSRFDRLSRQIKGMLLDLSKQRIQPKTLTLLADLASEKNLKQAIEDLFTGEIVNKSELRPALHTALRQSQAPYAKVDGACIGAMIQENLDKMSCIVDKVHAGKWLGYNGQPINTVVNIGVGGSDVGPKMVCEALNEYQKNSGYPIKFLFVSSIDGSQLAEMLQHLDQATTLFILASKTFTTVDTLANAETAKAWLRKKIFSDGLIGKHHFLGCSAHPARMQLWGIPENNQIALWDWVGGRYSLWCGIGLPIALKIGMDGFKQLLAGAETMDQHFRTQAFGENLPVLLALVGVWNINILGLKAHTILPYDGRLKFLPNYLSQLEMESNGKSVTSEGARVTYDTSPVIWGDVGANAQHAFFQLLHQGTSAFFADFIVPIKRTSSKVYSKATQEQLQHQQLLNLANCIAQSRVLMMGDNVLQWESNREQLPERLYAGNHASTTIMIDELTPHSLGSLLALYEHKVYVQAVIWGINPFDQWGVELGKKIAKNTLSAIEQSGFRVGTDANQFDASTYGLLDRVSKLIHNK